MRNMRRTRKFKRKKGNGKSYILKHPYFQMVYVWFVVVYFNFYFEISHFENRMRDRQGSLSARKGMENLFYIPFGVQNHIFWNIPIFKWLMLSVLQKQVLGSFWNLPFWKWNETQTGKFKRKKGNGKFGLWSMSIKGDFYVPFDVQNHIFWNIPIFKWLMLGLL